jgi:transposase
LAKFVLCPPTNPLRASITNEEQRAFIKLHYFLDDSAKEIYRLLSKAAGSLAYSRRQVFNIYDQFDKGERTSCEDQPRSGRPHTADTPENREKLKKLLYEDNNWTTNDYAIALDVSQYTVHCMLHEMGVKKLSSRWVPHEFNPAQKELRVENCQEQLDSHEVDNTFLNRIISIVKTWIKSYDPKDSQASKKWTLPSQEP